MKVSELIRHLSTLKQDATVVIQRDTQHLVLRPTDFEETTLKAPHGAGDTNVVIVTTWR